MTGQKAIFAGLIMSALFSSVVFAADCTIEKAGYAEPDGAFSLQFEPASSENTPVSHRFGITAGASGLKLDGHVMYDEDGARPVGMVMHNCPEGDVTGEDLRACIVWEGVIYASDGAGNIDVLPPEGGAAPAGLLLSGFGPALRHHQIWDKVKVLPWDLFQFKGCAS